MFQRKKKATNEEVFLPTQLSFVASEAYKQLRTNLFFLLPDDMQNGGKVIGFTSTYAAEFKSSTCLNLAKSIADSGLQVLLLDCDLRRSKVARALGLKDKRGLTDFLSGQEEAYVHRNVLGNKNLSVMLAGPIPPNPSELLGSNRMEKKVNLLRKQYDYIIMDLPPQGIVSDAAVASKLCDGIIVVVRQGIAERKTLHSVVKQLELVKANILGFVFAGADRSSKRRYGRRYGKYYSKNYGEYK